MNIYLDLFCQFVCVVLSLYNIHRYCFTMRKELILVLLGIICTSFLSSFMSSFVQVESQKVLLDTVVGVVGVVGAGNFSYWQLGHNGLLLIELTSLSGDADLYVSENIRPSYEIDKNNFSSATCGTDMVNIPPEFPRPLGIGVFGHWSHSESEYSIQVFLDKSEGGGSFDDYDRSSHEEMGSGDTENMRREKSSRKTEEERPKFFLKLLNILDMIFEMFIL